MAIHELASAYSDFWTNGPKLKRLRSFDNPVVANFCPLTFVHNSVDFFRSICSCCTFSGQLFLERVVPYWLSPTFLIRCTAAFQEGGTVGDIQERCPRKLRCEGRLGDIQC